MRRWPLVALAALTLAVPAASAAQKPCWQRVITDWYEDGKIDGDWSCNCLQKALDQIPVDVYASARQMIDAARKQACAAAASPVERVVPAPVKKHHRNLPALITTTVLGVAFVVLLLWRRRQAATSRDARRAPDRE